VTILGCGAMGEALGFRLIEKKVHVTIWNRSIDKTAGLSKAVATAVGDLISAVRATSTVIIILTTGAICESVLKDAAPALSGRTVINMSSILPQESTSLASLVTSSGGTYLEAPVSGTPIHIKRGVLSILCSAINQKVFEASVGLLSNFGTSKWIGSLGQACAMKMAINSYMATQVAGFAFGTAICHRAGLAPESFVETLQARGQFYSPHLDFIGPSMFTRQYEPAMFQSKLLLKDIHQVMELATEQGVDTAVIQAVGDVASRAVALGKGEQNYSVLYEVVNPIYPAAEKTTEA